MSINISMLLKHNISLSNKRITGLAVSVFKNMLVLFYSNIMFCNTNIQKLNKRLCLFSVLVVFFLFFPISAFLCSPLIKSMSVLPFVLFSVLVVFFLFFPLSAFLCSSLIKSMSVLPFVLCGLAIFL